MYKHSNDLDSLFLKFKQGDAKSVDALLKLERPFLFDYAMRMTGQISKSSELVEEGLQAIKATAANAKDLRDLRVRLYSSVRSNGLEDWSAETSRLENSAYLTPQALKLGKTLATLISIEHVIRSLSPNQREVFILCHMLGFLNHEMIDIMDNGAQLIEESLEQSTKVVKSCIPENGDDMHVWIQKLFLFQEPVEELMHTQNLSLVIKDIKRSSYKSYFGVLKLIFWIFIAVAGVYVVTHSGMIAQALK